MKGTELSNASDVKRVKFRDIVAYEKYFMNPSMAAVSYKLVPAYVIVSALILIAFGVMMSVDEERFLVPGIICLVAFALISVCMLPVSKYARKRSLENDMDMYNFDTSEVQPREVWDYSTDECALLFDRYGMYVDGTLYYYNHMVMQVLTSNRFQRIGVYLQFIYSEEYSIILPVCGDTLKMLESLCIELDNQEILHYIVSNKEEAFGEIFAKGYVNTK